MSASNRIAALAIAALILLLPRSGAAQHEHHGAAAGATAQPALTGTVLCADGPPLAGAIVQLVHEMGATRHIMATAVTDGAGRFVLRTAAGEYTLQVSYIGHSTHEREVTLRPAAAPTSIGTLRLEIAALHLDAITVGAERERVQLRSGATLVEAATSTAAGGTVADLLRTVPGVELQPDGRIAMRGSASVLVLVNGRRMPLTGDALAAFLRQMPASALERVEAGTAASARQDADGIGGIINLVFREDAQTHTGSRSIAASIATEDHYLASASAAGALGSAFSWDLAWSLSSMRPATVSETSRENLLPGEPVRRSDQNSSARAIHRLHSLMSSAALRLDNAATLGLHASWTGMQGSFANTTLFENSAPSGVQETSETRSVIRHTIPNAELGVRLDREPARGGFRFSTEARSALMREDFSGSYTHPDHFFMKTGMDATAREHAVQADAGLTMGAVTLEFGQKAQLRTLRTRFETEHEGMESSGLFRHSERVLAGYASAHRAFGVVQLQAGLRVEAERTRIIMDVEEEHAAVRMFPSLLLQWQHPGSDRVRYRVSWGRRLQRPTAAELNPFSMGEDDMNSFVGNPLLRPEQSDQLELGVEFIAPRTTAQVTPFLRITNDPIRPIKAVSQSGQATTSLQNLARTRAAGSDISTRTALGDRFTLTLAASLFHMVTEGLDYRNDGVYATARANLDAQVAPRTLVQLYLYRRGTQAIEQGEILPVTTTEMALTHRLGSRDQGRLTLRLADPLEGDRLAFELRDRDFVQHSSRRTSRPLVSLFLSWAVGGEPREDAPIRVEPARPQIF